MKFGFNRQVTRSDKDILSDKIYAAMETGNAGSARKILADHIKAFPKEVAAIQVDVMKDYGVRL